MAENPGTMRSKRSWLRELVPVKKGPAQERELRNLSRLELLESLLEQMRENERLRAELEDARKQLADRKLEIEEAGSIAQAALQVSGIFEAAQMAADLYLENVHRVVREKSTEKNKPRPSPPSVE